MDKFECIFFDPKFASNQTRNRIIKLSDLWCCCDTCITTIKILRQNI